jgi:uncharacterized membrane protein YphA (DoxX/SURF4 family)
MKRSLIIIRWFVGLLFIFSGLIKANDPLGLSYKMQEFFEVWGLQSLNDYTLAFALVMNVFEVLAGVAVIIGWRMRLFSWLLLLLIIFFCFLTAYAYLTGNIKTCGCFGDCIPLTPLASFIKDLILLILILVLFVNRNNIRPSTHTPLPQTILLTSIAGVGFLQWYALNYLPPKDCLPYKVGDNIVANMQVKPGNEPVSEFTYVYKKDGKTVELSQDSLEKVNLDSTYEFVKRDEKIIKEGVPAKIAEFSLISLNGNDTTADIFNQQNYYVMLFANDFSTYDEWHNKDFEELLNELSVKHIPFYLVTSQKEKAVELFGNDKRVNILICDGTVIKTAARVNSTYFVMQKADVKGKYSYKNFDELNNQIKTLPADLVMK